MTVLSSRKENDQLALGALSDAELELISAFLYITKLGKNVSTHRTAAYTLMQKIEDIKGDSFLQESSIDVDIKVDILDQTGYVERSVGHNWIEIDV